MVFPEPVPDSKTMSPFEIRVFLIVCIIAVWLLRGVYGKRFIVNKDGIQTLVKRVAGDFTETIIFGEYLYK